MMEMRSLFGLLFLASFVNNTKISSVGDGGKIDHYNAIKHYVKITNIFRKALDIELLPNGKYIRDPLKEIDDYSFNKKSRIKDFMKYCVRILRKFDEKLTIKPFEVIFKSFYYKILRWLNYHLSQIQDVKVLNNEMTDCINDIIMKREISNDIRIAFDWRIYKIKIPKQLTLFGQEVDNVVQLIYEIETRDADLNKTDVNEPNVPFPSFDDDGRKKFRVLVSWYLVRCLRIEVYENFIRKLNNNNDDYSDYDSSFRQLKLMGLVDVVMIFFRGNYKMTIDYETVDLKDYPRGTVGHFKHASLLFLQAFEYCVFYETLGELTTLSYLFQKAFIENFSTRNKAFNLRLCSLNLQVQIALDSFLEVFVSYPDQLQDPSLKATAYRLLKWFSKYAKFRACSYAETKIIEILSKIQENNPITDDFVLHVRIPRGLNNLQKLIAFATHNEDKTDESFSEEDDNNDTYVPDDSPPDIENLPDEEMKGTFSMEREGGGTHLTSNSLDSSDTKSYMNLEKWIDSIGNFIIGPSFQSIKSTFLTKVKSIF